MKVWCVEPINNYDVILLRQEQAEAIEAGEDFEWYSWPHTLPDGEVVLLSAEPGPELGPPDDNHLEWHRCKRGLGDVVWVRSDVPAGADFNFLFEV